MVKQYIVPAIIPASYMHLEKRLREVRSLVRSVQIDVMDGTYTHTTSWPYVGANGEVLASSRQVGEGIPFWQEFDLEIDLMVRNPLNHLEHWALSGAARVIVHVESTDNLAETIGVCKDRRLEIGLALKPSTSIDVLAPYMGDVVLVQCMGSDRIGYHGVLLNEKLVPEKIRAINARWPETLIGVDIGVNESTLPILYAAGARRFAAGSAVFGLGAPARSIRVLQEVLATCARTS